MKFLSTIIYLKPRQIFYRILKHFKHFHVPKTESFDCEPIILFSNKIHFNQFFLKRFNVDNLENGYITIFNKKIPLDFSNCDDISPLVFFNLQYFEYCIVLGATFQHTRDSHYYQIFKNIFHNYLESNIEYNSYVISIQIVNWIVILNCFETYDNEVYEEIYKRYKFLLKNTELHLLANHYFENVKAILICSKIFKEQTIFNKYLQILKKEMFEQFLDDGSHYERSFMYSKIILEDLLILRTFIDEKWLNLAINKLTTICYSVEHFVGRTPLFNDSGNNVAKPIDALIDSVPQIRKCFPDSGYYILEDKGIAVLIDCGNIGPKYNPGHSHCDCLSYELSINKVPILVNSGTYGYQTSKRPYFRSSIAHNTFMVNNHEQSENWGEHRVGRRIKNVKMLHFDSTSFEGSFNNYLGEQLTRNICLLNNCLKVVDTGPRGSSVRSFLHLSPICRFENNGIYVGKQMVANIEPLNCDISISTSLYSEDFGKLETNIMIEFVWIQDENKHGYSIIFKEF